MVKKQIPYFNLEQIADSGQCFRWTRLDKDKYGIVAYGKYLEVSQCNDEVIFDCSQEDFDDIWNHYFDLETDYGSIINGISEKDEFLRDAVNTAGGIRILNQELWEMVISYIISQNNNIPRIKKSIEFLCRGIGRRIAEDLYGFPEYEQLAAVDKNLIAGAGLGYRDVYIFELCEKYDEEEIIGVTAHMNYKQALEYYMNFKGIGRKVANCICLFGLHHLDACPIDTWMRRIIDEEYNGNMPEWMTGEYAGVYQQYAFYYKRVITKM